MILSNSIPTLYAPEVNLKKFYGLTCCLHNDIYRNGIDGSVVVKYIKRCKASL